MTMTRHPEHFVDRAAMAAMRLTLGSPKGSVNGPGARKALDELMERVPAAPGVACEPASVGGNSGWWCRPEDAVKGAAILCLHGGGYVVGAAQSCQHLVGQIAVRLTSTNTMIAELVQDWSSAEGRKLMPLMMADVGIHATG
jgi:epsilon-lactone hydrolase